MYQSEWYQKLRQLNPRLKVCQFNNSNHLPGIYYIHEREGIVDICATDKTWVPAKAEYDSRGFLIKSGYRRVIFTLLQLKLTTREKVREVFPSFFEQRYPLPSPVQVRSIHRQWSEMMKEHRAKLNILGDAQQVDVEDAIVDKMKQMEMDNFNRRSSAALSGDQFLELSYDIEEDMTDAQRKALDEAKFNYDRAVGKRKTII